MSLFCSGGAGQRELFQCGFAHWINAVLLIDTGGTNVDVQIAVSDWTNAVLPIGVLPSWHRPLGVAIAIEAELPSISKSLLSVVVLPIGISHSGIAHWESSKINEKRYRHRGGAIVDFQIASFLCGFANRKLP